MTDNANGGRERDARRRRMALLAVAALVALVAVVLFLRPAEPAPQGPTPTPPAAGTESPVTSPSAGPSEPASSNPSPAGDGTVGDYRCLTLPDATAAVERDGFAVGNVAFTLEGGPVADDWLVSNQTPEPGAQSPAGTTIDLVLSSPFMVCPTP